MGGEWETLKYSVLKRKSPSNIKSLLSGHKELPLPARRSGNNKTVRVTGDCRHQNKTTKQNKTTRPSKHSRTNIRELTVQRGEVNTSPHPYPEANSDWQSHAKEKLVFSKGVQTTLKGMPHAQQQMVNTIQTKWYLEGFCLGIFLTLQVFFFCLYITVSDFVFFVGFMFVLVWELGGFPLLT